MNSKVIQAAHPEIRAKIEEINKRVDEQGLDFPGSSEQIDDVLAHAHNANDRNAIVCILINKWASHIMRLEKRRSHDCLRQLQRVIEHQANPLLGSYYYKMKGTNLSFCNQELDLAQRELQKAISFYQKANAEKIDGSQFGLTFDYGLLSYSDFAIAAVMRGKVDQATAALQQSLSQVETNEKLCGEAHNNDVLAKTWLGAIYCVTRQRAKAREIYATFPSDIKSYTFGYIAKAFDVWSRIDECNTAELSDTINRVLVSMDKNGTRILRTLFESIRLTVLIKGAEYEEVISRANSAIDTAEETGDQMGLSGLYRLRAYAKDALDRVEDDVLSDLDSAVEISAHQGADLLLLRAANQRRRFEQKNNLIDRSSHIIEECLGSIESTTLLPDVDEGEALLLSRIAA